MSPSGTAVHGVGPDRRRCVLWLGRDRERAESGGQKPIRQSEDLSSGASPAINSLCDVAEAWSCLSINFLISKMRYIDWSRFLTGFQHIQVG